MCTANILRRLDIMNFMYMRTSDTSVGSADNIFNREKEIINVLNYCNWKCARSLWRSAMARILITVSASVGRMYCRRQICIGSVSISVSVLGTAVNKALLSVMAFF